jgi:hypothetical protein
MRNAIIRALAITAGTSIAVAGCQWLGPNAIHESRDRYNDIIQATTKNQTLANIVRVYNHEPTLFMDVTEVDAAQSFQGQLTGGAAGIGANTGTSGSSIMGRTGSAQGMAQYSESPTIRYFPLLGQALVEQLVQPVSVDVLGQLTDSDWPAGPVLNFALDYLTSDFDESYTALNAIMELDNYQALQYSAAQSDLTKAKSDDKTVPGAGMVVNVQTTPAKAGTKDTLVIYLLPYHPHETELDSLKKKTRVLQLWTRLLRLYAGTQPQSPENLAKPTSLKTVKTGCDSFISAGQYESLDDLDKFLTCLGIYFGPIDLDSVKKDSNQGKDLETILSYVNDTFKSLPQSIELRTEPVLVKTVNALKMAKASENKAAANLDAANKKLAADAGKDDATKAEDQKEVDDAKATLAAAKKRPSWRMCLNSTP